MIVDIPYDPRPQQKELHEKLKEFRFSVLACHRRFGKSVMLINHLLIEALLNTKKNPRYAYIAPTYRQAKNIAWDYLKQYAGVIPGARFHETELRCDLPNGARITLLSSETPDSIRGIFLDGACCDEMAQIDPTLWNEVLRPCLSDRKGWCVFIGTPAGMSNQFYELYQYALTHDDWFAYTAPASKTNIVDEGELKAAREQMGEEKYQQEFECSWIANISGSIFGSIIKDLEDKKQLTRVPYNPAFPVNTSWDIGVGDSTAIIFYQQIGAAIHIIDYYENNKEGLPHYCDIVSKKDYYYKTHYAPHDIEVTEFSSGKTRRDVAYQLGINFKILPKLPLEDGIHSAKMILPRCWIDMDNCKHLVNALRHYHRKYNEKMKIFHSKPVHAWSSHAADAFRYLALSVNEVLSKSTSMPRATDSEYKIFSK